MKKIYPLLLLLFCLMAGSICLAQGIGINETGAAPDGSAILDVSSTTKGTLLTRMTTSQRDDIDDPATGLLIFNTETNCFETYIYGFWQTMFCGCPGLPATPGTISGSTTVYRNQTNVVYTVPAIANATSYIYGRCLPALPVAAAPIA